MGLGTKIKGFIRFCEEQKKEKNICISLSRMAPTNSKLNSIGPIWCALIK